MSFFPFQAPILEFEIYAIYFMDVFPAAEPKSEFKFFDFRKFKLIDQFLNHVSSFGTTILNLANFEVFTSDLDCAM